MATAVNAYRRALDSISRGEFTAERVKTLMSELDKASHRQYTTGFCFDEEQSRQYYEDSKAVEEYKFIAVVKGYEKGIVTVEQRNRFCEGDVLEVLSPSAEGSFAVKNITDQEGLWRHRGKQSAANAVFSLSLPSFCGGYPAPAKTDESNAKVRRQTKRRSFPSFFVAVVALCNCFVCSIFSLY